MPKTPSEISILLNSLNAEVSIFRSTYAFDESRWACTIVVSSKETELKVRVVGDSCEEVYCMAFDKLEPMLDAPAIANALAIPLLPSPVE